MNHFWLLRKNSKKVFRVHTGFILDPDLAFNLNADDPYPGNPNQCGFRSGFAAQLKVDFLNFFLLYFYLKENTNPFLTKKLIVNHTLIRVNKIVAEKLESKRIYSVLIFFKINCKRTLIWIQRGQTNTDSGTETSV
jgi:hypothetical protein